MPDAKITLQLATDSAMRDLDKMVAAAEASAKKASDSMGDAAQKAATDSQKATVKAAETGAKAVEGKIGAAHEAAAEAAAEAAKESEAAHTGAAESAARAIKNKIGGAHSNVASAAEAAADRAAKRNMAVASQVGAKLLASGAEVMGAINKDAAASMGKVAEVGREAQQFGAMLAPLGPQALAAGVAAGLVSGAIKQIIFAAEEGAERLRLAEMSARNLGAAVAIANDSYATADESQRRVIDAAREKLRRETEIKLQYGADISEQEIVGLASFDRRAAQNAADAYTKQIGGAGNIPPRLAKFFDALNVDRFSASMEINARQANMPGNAFAGANRENMMADRANIMDSIRYFPEIVAQYKAELEESRADYAARARRRMNGVDYDAGAGDLAIAKNIAGDLRLLESIERNTRPANNGLR